MGTADHLHRGLVTQGWQGVRRGWGEVEGGGYQGFVAIFIFVAAAKHFSLLYWSGNGKLTGQIHTNTHTLWIHAHTDTYMSHTCHCCVWVCVWLYAHLFITMLRLNSLHLIDSETQVDIGFRFDFIWLPFFNSYSEIVIRCVIHLLLMSSY